MKVSQGELSNKPHTTPNAGERGVVILEFAIAASMYFLLIFTLFEFTIQFQKHLTVADIMRQASREAVVKEQAGSCADISNRAVQEFDDRLAQYGMRSDRHGASVRSHRSDEPNSGTSLDTLGVDLDIGLDNSSIVGSLFGGLDLVMDSRAFVPLEDVGDTMGCP